MDIFGVLTMIGGVALFLYGMHVMGEGLSKLAGSSLEKVLEKLASGKVKAIFLGAVVTAVIQSSAATTVMLVGLVNSGIMKLSQAVGVIMGANIGTTMTSWILSLSGIEDGNFFVQMLKPSSFCPILAIIGTVFVVFTKSKKKRDIGTIMIGFAVLMFGMETISDAVRPLKDVPEFINLFTLFKNPILGMIVGAVLTAAIQSSSASVGILQALCMTGKITYGAAIPIIMGQNIGTCVTALLSSIGAKTNARRAALVHLYFNVLGTIIFMVGFYSLNVFIKFRFLDDAAGAIGIAIIHTCFNIGATVILSIFSDFVEKLAVISVKEEKVDEENKRFDILDSRFLDTPGFAIEKARSATNAMARVANRGVNLSLDLLNNYDEKIMEEVLRLEDIVDKYEDKIGTYLLKINSENIMAKDSATVTMLLRTIVDIERISDHSVNIMQSAKELYDKKLSFTEQGQKEMQLYAKAISDILTYTTDVFNNNDVEAATQIEPFEEVIDNLSTELKGRHVKRLREGNCSIELGFVWNDILTNCERVSDHCSNIAVTIIEIESNENDRHGYLKYIKKDNIEEFTKKTQEFAQRYALP